MRKYHERNRVYDTNYHSSCNLKPFKMCFRTKHGNDSDLHNKTKDDTKEYWFFVTVIIVFLHSVKARKR